MRNSLFNTFDMNCAERQFPEPWVHPIGRILADKDRDYWQGPAQTLEHAIPGAVLTPGMTGYSTAGNRANRQTSEIPLDDCGIQAVTRRDIGEAADGPHLTLAGA